MKNTIFASIIGIFVTLSALAAVGDTTFTANQTQAGTCVVGTTGTGSGTANTLAHWTVLTYACPAGTYLPDGDTWSSDNQYTSGNCKQCTAGSYCAGSGSTPFTYSEASDQGITSCGGTYPNSDAGSDAAADCYRNCTAADVSHLKSGGTVSGRYYSNNTNECEPADAQQCATGYSYTAGAPDPDLNTIIGFGGGEYGYKSNDGENESMNADEYGLSQNGTWVVMYTGKAIVRGISQCSSQNGTGIAWPSDPIAETPSEVTTRDTLTDSSGQYCYCQLTSYNSNASNKTAIGQSLITKWVFLWDENSGTECAHTCAARCASYMRDDDSPSYLIFRGAVFNTVPGGPAQCSANTISIQWASANGIFETNSCTYDGSITTPTNAPTKRGHVFTGWTFVAQ